MSSEKLIKTPNYFKMEGKIKMDLLEKIKRKSGIDPELKKIILTRWFSFGLKTKEKIIKAITEDDNYIKKSETSIKKIKQIHLSYLDEVKLLVQREEKKGTTFFYGKL